MYRIPLIQADIGVEEREGVGSVLRSGKLWQGEVVEEFEERFRQYVGADYAVAVSSGSAALQLALTAGGVGGKPEIMMPALAPAATRDVILRQGNKPAYVDVDTTTLTVFPACVEEAITDRTGALVLVHLCGCPCDVSALTDIATRHGIRLIEDACEAHGAEYCGRKIGSSGTCCFSFGKGAGMTTGEGGMLCTDDVDIAAIARVMRDNSEPTPQGAGHCRLSCRMTEVAAAIGLCQLERLDGYIGIRRENARLLTNGLTGIPGIGVPRVMAEPRHVFTRYPVRITPEFPVSRDIVQRALIACGIESAPCNYCVPDEQEAEVAASPEELQTARRLERELLCLPVGPHVTSGDIELIVDVVRRLSDREHLA